MTSRTRSGQVFSATYDALNRPTAITAPAPIAGQVAADGVAYVYDNLGRPLSATIPGSPPVTTAMTWDALGRQTTETGPLGTMTMAYDPAGRRTSMLWPDGFEVEYLYDVTNAMTRIQRSDTLPIALYAYDDLGRRTSVTRPNGVNTAYGYDPASRLTSLVNDFPSAANDNTYTYQHNPAGQITGLSSANDAYAWTGLATGTDTYGLDGLNRVTTVNGQARTYDANSNLTHDGVREFRYDAANRKRYGV